MIIPNIWENKSHVSNHQSVFQWHHQAAFHTAASWLDGLANTTMSLAASVAWGLMPWNPPRYVSKMCSFFSSEGFQRSIWAKIGNMIKTNRMFSDEIAMKSGTAVTQYAAVIFQRIRRLRHECHSSNGMNESPPRSMGWTLWRPLCTRQCWFWAFGAPGSLWFMMIHDSKSWAWPFRKNLELADDRRSTVFRFGDWTNMSKQHQSHRPGE